MRRSQFAFSLSLALCLVPSVWPQSAAGIIDSKRRIDWSTVGVAGGIPNRTTTCATLNPGATYTQINTAIANCPSNQVVFLNAGTYNLAGGINIIGKSNITLRGAGPDQTFLVFTGNTGCTGAGGSSVCISDAYEGYWGNPQNTANWTGGYTKGSTSITLDSKANLSVGGILNLDQLDDPNVDNGDLWVCSTLNICSREDESQVRRPGRGQGQTVVVTSISSGGCPCTIGITPGLYMPNWSASKSPGAWWPSTPTYGVGIENLSLDHTNSGAGSGIYIANTRDSWIRNIRSINSDRAHIWGTMTTRFTVRDSYLYGTKNAQWQSYGIEVDDSSAWLGENIISQHVAAPFVTGEQSSGHVWGYNFSVDHYYTVTPTWMTAGYYHHAIGINYNLFESNHGNGFEGDDIHGTSHFLTAFRNYWEGLEPGKNLNTYPINIEAFNRFYNFIGNVLGTVGYHDTYECYPSLPTTPTCVTGPETSIYMLDWSDEGARLFSNFSNDLAVRSTMMRWGNYDTVTRSARWVAGEVPSSISSYSNPVPASQTLPRSFYLNTRPYWWSTPWGTPPWPAIGPDVTGGPGPGGHAYTIPAELCYSHTPIDTAYGAANIRLFNATACYAQGNPPPNPPANLSAGGH